MFKIIATSILAIMLAGCATTQTVVENVQEMPSSDPSPLAKPIVKTKVSELDTIAGPNGPPITIAVYNFTDKTGQRKPNNTIATLSSAVTQGGEVFLIKALQDAGKGKWFQVVERVGLDDLIKERQLIRNQRETYEGKDSKPLSPMLVAGILVQGGIVGYDSNIGSGGAGAALLGIGSSAQYRTDEVTVVIRLVSVHTGEVLVSAGASKTILSAGIDNNVMKFLDRGTMSVQIEAGANVNEPSTYAVRVATEAAVVDMIRQGAVKKLWQFASISKKKN
jgi:curli production assembly/transport component CsgG